MTERVAAKLISRMRYAWHSIAMMCAFAISGCVEEPPPPQPHDYRIETVAKGLVTPWSLALAPDGRLFVAERPGRIRVVMNDTLLREPWATIPAFEDAEAGLMGLALDADFPANGYAYICYTERIAPGRIVNRIAKLHDRNNHGEQLTVLLDGIPAGRFHNGCRVKIGPDRKLYVTTGDAFLKSPAQDISSLAGKILRINLDGSIPLDNPIPNSPVWSLGHRNPQGIAWDPQSGVAYITEHGDSLIDEINVLERGANYGWPDVQGIANDARYKNPALVFHVSPTGAAFMSETLPESAHQMLITSLKGILMRLTVNGGSVSVADDSVLAGYGRLRDVVAAPDGSVYVSTSNRDGRGTKRRGDDRILHIWFR